MTYDDMLLNFTVRLDALDARLDRIEAQPVIKIPVKPAPAPKPSTSTINPGATPHPLGWDVCLPYTAPYIDTLFDTLRQLLPGTNADGSLLSDADILARAIDKITTLESEADLAAWRDIVMESPPLRSDLLFANHSEIWVGQAHAVSCINTINGERPTEIVYYRNGDLMDGDPPIAWAILPILEDPADPGLDPEI